MKARGGLIITCIDVDVYALKEHEDTK